MSEREGFLRSIADDVYDDTPRLIFADWLEDHGEPERAEFIRVQCELEPIREQYEIDRADEFQDREQELLGKHKKKWLGRMPKDWDDWKTGVDVEFRRGFVDIVSMPVRTFLVLGPKILKAHPTVRRLVLFWVNEYGEALASCPALEGVPELELACWYSDEDAYGIASSAHLSRLQVLELWLGRGEGDLTDTDLCRIMAKSKAWPQLRELALLDPSPEKEDNRTRKRLVSVANKAAGRKLAVYRRGYPELFPFADDFYYTFPGYLPDGRMAMAVEDARTDPPTLCVLTFDKKGKQTKTVIRVPMPAEVVAASPSVWDQFKDEMKQQLIDTIGFRPGFIRIQGCRFPGDTNGYDSPSWDEEPHIGALDTDEDSGSDSPNGYGGWATYRVKGGQWGFGWDRFGDKSGTIHST